MKRMWNKIERMIAGVMLTTLLVAVGYGLIGMNSKLQISVYGEAPEWIEVIL